MAEIKYNFNSRDAEFPNRFSVESHDKDGNVTQRLTVFVERDPGRIYDEGTAFNRENMENFKRAIEEAIEVAEASAEAAQKDASQGIRDASSASAAAASAQSTANAAIPKSNGNARNLSVNDLVITNGDKQYDSTIWNGDVGTLVLQSHIGTVNIVDKDHQWGDLQLRTVYQNSSRRFKDNIRDTDDKSAEALLHVPIVDYEYKVDSGSYDGGATHTGVTAEELAQVDSRYVLYEDGKPTAVSYLDMIPAIIRLLQLQENEIADLKEKLDEALYGGNA